MGREKKVAPGRTRGNHAKDRHKKDRNAPYSTSEWFEPLPPGLVARPDRPKPSDNFKSYFEFVENKDKKKKLEIKMTTDTNAPPGYVFVPSGNPELTHECKELSRKADAMVFIVTKPFPKGHSLSVGLGQHLNRVGCHFRETIAVEARKHLGIFSGEDKAVELGKPEPIPEDQDEINAQADAALRDLFPRIPNTDRQQVLEQSFSKKRLKPGDTPVGLAADIPLTRRVQLAVLAHIRHTHTRYDKLLRETTYVNARRITEKLCLDYLVKWRGDEETGRDQMDEILREVVIISDSDDSEGDEDDDTTTESDENRAVVSHRMRGTGTSQAIVSAARVQKRPGRTQKMVRNPHRGFTRYQAAYDQAWREALERRRDQESNTQQVVDLRSPEPMDLNRSASLGPVQMRHLGEILVQTGHARRPSSDTHRLEGELHTDSAPGRLVRELSGHTMDAFDPAFCSGERREHTSQRVAGEPHVFHVRGQADWIGRDTRDHDNGTGFVQFHEPISPRRVRYIEGFVPHGHEIGSRHEVMSRPHAGYRSLAQTVQRAAHRTEQISRGTPLVHPEHASLVTQSQDTGLLPAFIELSRAPERRYIPLNRERSVSRDDQWVRTASNPDFVNAEPLLLKPNPRAWPEQLVSATMNPNRQHHQGATLGPRAHQPADLHRPYSVASSTSAPRPNDVLHRLNERYQEPSQILHVSNKFPPRYEIPPAAVQRELRSVPEVQPRSDRVTSMIHEPARRPKHDASATIWPNTIAGSSQIPRERIIGYEYGVQRQPQGFLPLSRNQDNDVLFRSVETILPSRETPDFAPPPYARN